MRWCATDPRATEARPVLWVSQVQDVHGFLGADVIGPHNRMKERAPPCDAAVATWIKRRKGEEVNSEEMLVKGEQVKRVEMAPGVLRRTLAYGGEMLLAEFTVQAGAEVAEHSHPHAQVGYVVRGRMRMTIGDKTGTFEAGDSYYIPGDVVHGAVTTEDTVVVDVFCPPRQDYMEG